MRFDSNWLRPFVLVLVALLMLAPVAPLGAQTFVTPTGEAQNVRFEQRNSGVVEIFYDLISSDPRAVFSVVLEGSQDNGGTWGMRPKTLSGDVGEGIRPGVGKKIVWDSGKDVERIQFNSLRFRMAATGGQLAANTSKPGTSGAKPPTGQNTAVNQPSGGGGGKKKLLIIGGSVLAAGGTAAVLLAGGKPAAPSVTNSSITGNNGTLLASLVTLTFRVSVSNKDNEALTASWNFGDGTTGSAAISGGEASVTKVYSAAGTYSPTVTINGGKGGTGSGTYPSVVVATLTGRWSGSWTTLSGLTAVLNLSQNGTTLSGDVTVNGSNFLNPGRITGTIGSPAAITMRFTDTSGGFYDLTLTGATPFTRFEGTATGATSVPWVMTKQ